MDDDIGACRPSLSRTMPPHTSPGVMPTARLPEGTAGGRTSDVTFIPRSVDGPSSAGHTGCRLRPGHQCPLPTCGCVTSDLALPA